MKTIQLNSTVVYVDFYSLISRPMRRNVKHSSHTCHIHEHKTFIVWCFKMDGLTINYWFKPFCRQTGIILSGFKSQLVIDKSRMDRVTRYKESWSSLIFCNICRKLKLKEEVSNIVMHGPITEKKVKKNERLHSSRSNILPRIIKFRRIAIVWVDFIFSEARRITLIWL